MLYICNNKITAMTVVSSRVFLENPSHFFNLARKEDLAIKRGQFMFRIIPNLPPKNISPSGDPFWADKRNVDALNRRLAAIHNGTEKSVPLNLEALKNRMGL